LSICGVVTNRLEINKIASAGNPSKEANKTVTVSNDLYGHANCTDCWKNTSDTHNLVFTIGHRSYKIKTTSIKTDKFSLGRGLYANKKQLFKNITQMTSDLQAVVSP
jgi:hypothetical protein